MSDPLDDMCELMEEYIRLQKRLIKLANTIGGFMSEVYIMKEKYRGMSDEARVGLTQIALKYTTGHLADVSAEKVRKILGVLADLHVDCFMEKKE